MPTAEWAFVVAARIGWRPPRPIGQVQVNAMCRALTSLVVTGLVSGGQCRSRSGAQQASRRKLVSRSVRKSFGGTAWSSFWWSWVAPLSESRKHQTQWARARWADACFQWLAKWCGAGIRSEGWRTARTDCPLCIGLRTNCKCPRWFISGHSTCSLGHVCFRPESGPHDKHPPMAASLWVHGLVDWPHRERCLRLGAPVAPVDSNQQLCGRGGSLAARVFLLGRFGRWGKQLQVQRLGAPARIASAT